MSAVDNRVVRMTFDNAQFERNIRTTMNTLTDFEKSLKLEGATAGFEELKKSTDKLDMSAIGNKAAKEAGRVSESSADAAKSLSSIDQAADNVDMSGLGRAANSAVNEVNEAASNTDMSGISNETRNAADGFSAFETIAVGALLKVGDSITELVQSKLMSLGNTIKKYTLDPITDGFSEYEQQIGSIQTILANTGMDFDSDEDIQRVNDALDELNRYADETIYKFGDMTEAIGTFTASGMSLEDAIAAVKGTANVAAFSGASASDVHRVLPQLAQALSSGVVSLQDWRSVETAHMSSRGFVKTIGEVAKHMSEAGKASDAAAEAGQALIDKQVTIRQALNQRDNKDWAGWFTSDILSETLKAFTYDLTSATDDEEKAIRAHLAEIGFLNKEEQDELFKQAEMATRAATEVRTWTQLWDTVGESIGSNWAGIWRNLIGDFKQATDTFTFLSNSISDAVDGMLGGLVNGAKVFNQSGAIDLIFGGFKRYTQEDFEKGIIPEEMIGEKVVDELTNELVRIPGVLDNIVAAISAPLGAIGDAFNAIFGPGPDATPEEIAAFNDELAINLISIAQALFDFTQSLILSDDAVAGLRNIFEGLFAIMDVGIQIILDVGAAFFGIVDIIRTVVDPLIDIALTIGGQVGKVLVWIHDKFLEVRGAVIEAMQPLFNIIEVVKEVISAFFDFVDIPGKIDLVGDGLIGLLEILWKIIDIPGKIKAIGDLLGGVFGFIGEITGWNSAVEATNKIFEETGEKVNVVTYWFGELLKTPIGQFFKGIYDAVAGAVQKIKEFFLGGSGPEAENSAENTKGFIDIFKALEEAIGKAGEVLAPFFSSLGTGLLGAVGLFVRLIEAIGGFILRIGEAFLAWEPVRNVIDLLSNFRDNVVNFFLSLPDRIAGMNSELNGELGGFQDIFGGVIDWFNSTIEYFSNVSVEQFIADVQAWVNGIIDSVKNVFEYFATVDPSTLVNDIYNSILGALDAIGGGIRLAVRAIFGFDSEFGNSIIQGWNDYIYSPLVGFFSSIHKILSDVAKESDSIPEFIVNLFKRIGKAILDGIDSIIESIKAFTPQVFLDNWKGFSDSMYQTLVGWFPNLAPALSGAFDVLNSFFNDITKDADDWGDVFINVVKKIGEGLSFIPGMLVGAFGLLSDAVLGALGWLTEKLEQIPGPIGSFFGFINDRIIDLSNTLDAESTAVPDKFGQMVGGMNGPVDGALGELQRFWDGFKIENIPNYVGGFAENFKKFIGERFKDIGEFIKTIPDKFGEVITNFGEIFSEENINKLIDIINKVLIGKLIWSLSDFVSGLGNLTKGISKYLKHKDWESVSDQIKNVAIALAILSASLWVISTIENPQDSVVILLELAGVLIAMEVIVGLLQKFNIAGGDDLIKTAGSLTVLAIGILALMYAIEKLTAFDIKGNIKGLVSIGAIFVLFTAWTKLLGDGGKNAIQAAVAVGVLSLSLMLLLPAIQRITDFLMAFEGLEYGKMLLTLAALAGFVAALGGALRAAGDHGISAGIGFLALAASMHILAGAFSELDKLDIPHLVVSAIALGALVGSFAAIAHISDAKDLIATGAALVIFSASIAILASALDVLARRDWPGIAAAGASLGVLLGVLYLMTKNLKAGDLVATSAALIVFSAGVGVLSFALYQLTQVDAGSLIAAGVALGIVLGAFALIVAVTKESDLIATAGSILIFSVAVGALAASLGILSSLNTNLTASVVSLGILIGLFGVIAGILSTPEIGAMAAVVLPELALALIAFGAAALSIGVALNLAVMAIQSLALAAPILAQFAQMVGENLLNFGAAALALVALGLALVPLSVGLLAFGATSAIAAGGIALLTLALNGFLELAMRVQEFNDAGANITAGIGEGIGSGLDVVVQAVLGIGQAILNAFLGLFKINSPSQLMADEVGQYIPAGIAEGITGNSEGMNTSLSDTLGTLLGNFTTWVQEEGLPKLQEFGAGLLETLQREVLPNILDWVENEGIPKLGEMAQGVIDGIFEELGKMPERLLQWASEIPGHIWDGIVSAWDTLTNIGANIIDGIVGGITQAPDAIANSIVGVASNGLSAVQSFFGINSPSRVMRDEVGRYIPEGLALGITEYAKIAVKASQNLAKDVSNGVSKNISTINPDFGFGYGKITPVLDMSNVDAGMKTYANQWNGMDFSAINSNMQNIDANLDFTPMLRTALNQTDQISKLNSQNQELLNEISSLRNDVAEYNDVISKMRIVMDTGTLVGELSAPMDSALGMRQTMVGRGVL